MAFTPVQGPNSPQSPTAAWAKKALGVTIERCIAIFLPTHLALALA